MQGCCLGRVFSLCQYRDGALRANGQLGAWMVLEECVKTKHLPSPHLRFPPQRTERGAHLPCGQGSHQAPGGEQDTGLPWVLEKVSAFRVDIQVGTGQYLGTQLIAHRPPLWVRSHSPPVCVEHEWVLLTTPHPGLTTFLH